MKEFIEKLIGGLEHLLNNFGEHCEEWGSNKKGECYRKSCSDCVLTHAIEIVNQLAVEYKGTISKTENVGWIPCSERLPNKEEFLKHDGRFVVTDGNRCYQSIYDIYEGIFRTIKLYNNGGSVRGWNFEFDGCVIAWQPLPKPYKPKEEEQKGITI